MITVHDVAVFAVAVPRKPGVAWENVERSDAFVLIQAMIQQCVNDAVAEALNNAHEDSLGVD